MTDLPYVTLLGVRVHSLSKGEMLHELSRRTQAGLRTMVGYANVHALNLAHEEERFRAFLNRCDLTTCDGFGVKWGARVVGERIRERYTPPDWIDDLCAECAQRGWSVYLLGARPEVAELAALRLKARHPGLRIAGTHHGYFDKTGPDSDARVAAINDANTDVLIVGFGMPAQEYWLEDNWEALDARVAIPVGAAFDYLAGTVARGPRWMTDHGLEWLSRLVIEPRRLWRRYLIGNPRFFYRLLRESSASK